MEKVEINNQAAIDFLKNWSDGPWVLTSIEINRKAISTKTFNKDKIKELESWLKEFNGKRNIYFSVNPPLRELNKKADREDIKSVDWLHVDIDPRAGEKVEEEQERALSLLTTKLPLGVPKPTVIVFSGGGYQGFWKLETPLPVNGDLIVAENVKRYNQQLEILFGADNCHNIDRIMRLPGTVNLPDAKKIKKGRKPCLAYLVEFNKDLVYPISSFTEAPTVQIPGETGFSSSKEVEIKLSDEVERITDLVELDQWSVPDRVKIIIAQGKHPDEVKQGDNSRSIWVFDVVCQLVRCDVPDNVIYSILTDPDFGISESILEKGVNAKKYAIRQIERAKDEAIDPFFRELNEKHAVIGNIGGKCRIIEEIYNPALKKTGLTWQSFEDFSNRYRHIKVKVGEHKNGTPQLQPLGRFWIDHPKRRQFDTIIFSPGKEVPGAYNLWKGFSCQSKPGDCSLFLSHVKENICNGNEEIYNYVLNWMARAVQEPDSTGEVAIVLRGGRGTGKGFFAKIFGSLFGRHFLQVSNPQHLVGQFNKHLRDCVVLFADEAFFAGDKKHTSVLKTLITEESMMVEAKGIDVEASSNFIHLIMASNDDHVVPAGGDERRYLVIDVSKNQQQNTVYFAKLLNQMNNGGREALLHLLMNLDIKDFQVRNVPKTSALQDQKLLSLGPEEEWWYQRLCEGRILRKHDDWQIHVMKDELYDDFAAHSQRFNSFKRSNQTILGKFLHKLNPHLRQIQKEISYEVMHPEGYTTTRKGRKHFWVFSSLEEARKQWESLYGAEQWIFQQEQLEFSENVIKKEPF